MSRKRQTAIFDRLPDRRSEVTTLTHDYPAGHKIASHFHDRDQLVYASQGVMTVRTADAAWVVPTQRAVWIPAVVPHSITMSGRVAMRTLYFKPRVVKTRACSVVNVSPLLRELILHTCTLTTLKKTSKPHRHLIDTILDQLETVELVPLQLSNPSDPRALRIAKLLLADPGDRRPLAHLCKQSAVGKRTVERIFQDDLGMTFGKWRQQLRLMHAMRLLAEGAKVTHAALEAGYSTPSSFISMFRKALGTTPTSYFKGNATGKAMRREKWLF